MLFSALPNRASRAWFWVVSALPGSRLSADAPQTTGQNSYPAEGWLSERNEVFHPHYEGGFGMKAKHMRCVVVIYQCHMQLEPPTGPNSSQSIPQLWMSTLVSWDQTWDHTRTLDFCIQQKKQFQHAGTCEDSVIHPS